MLLHPWLLAELFMQDLKFSFVSQTSAFAIQPFHDNICYCLRAEFKNTYISKVGHLSKIEAPKSNVAIQIPHNLSLSTEGASILSFFLVPNTHLELCCCPYSVAHNTDTSFFKSKCDTKVRRTGSSSALRATSAFQQLSTT